VLQKSLKNTKNWFKRGVKSVQYEEDPRFQDTLP